MLCSVLRRESWRRLPVSAHVVVSQKGQPSSCFHANRFINERDCRDDVCDNEVMACFGGAVGAGGTTRDQRLFYGAGSLPMRVSEVVLGAQQDAGSLLRLWAPALTSLGDLVSYALLPGWSLGEQQGRAGAAEAESEVMEEEEGVEDYGFFSRWFDSVKRKRLAKMKRHKWKKRRREQRQSATKDYK